jgi:hypothetical protein
MKRVIYSSAMIGLAAILSFGLAPVAISKNDAPVKVSSGKAFKELQTVTIGTFHLAFINEKTDRAFSGRGNNYSGNSSEAKTNLAGVTSAEFQAITDAAYADFTAKLEAAGYRIADRADYNAEPGLARLQHVASGARGTVVLGKNSKANAYYYSPTAFGPTPIIPNDIGGGTFGVFAQMASVTARGTYVWRTKQPVMDVKYVVDYAGSKHYGGAFAMSSAIKIKAQLAIVPTVSQATLASPGGYGSIIFQQPVAVEGDFGDLADSTTRGQKADQAIGNAIRLLGGAGSASSKHFTFTAVPELYRDGSINAAERANTTVVTQMQGLR